MTLKKGDLFGAVYGEDSWLFCEAVRFDGDTMYAWVINGHWTARFNPNGTIDCIDGGGHVVNTVQNWRIAYTGVIPPGHKWDYNAAINFMIEQSKGSKLAVFMRKKKLALSMRCNRFARSVSAAKEAFLKSWTGKRKPRYEGDDEDDLDDEIAF